MDRLTIFVTAKAGCPGSERWGAWNGEEGGYREESKGWEYEDTALGSGRAAGEQRLPDGVGGE